MIGFAERAAMRALRCLDPETAHGLSIAALKLGVKPPISIPADPRLAVTIAGLSFPNPLGIAAGYDKNAEVPDALLRLGFGFVEVGTVTPKPQDGNPRPRIFRLSEDRGVINRLGFNNHGHAECLARLKTRSGKPGIVGVNIGANKDSTDRIGDYVLGVETFYDVASYLTVNISSPNTPGLRQLQGGDNLGELLTRVMEADSARADKTGRAVPVFLKVAPDLDDGELDAIAKAVTDHRMAGLIVSNTTLSRTGLIDTATAAEAGGLSGRPLFELSTRVLAKLRQRVGSDMAIIGVGGVESTETTLEKIRAGADLVQLYSAMVYEGPKLAATVLAGMKRFIESEGLASLRDIRDTQLNRWS